jgi:hypothetical protein
MARTVIVSLVMKTIAARPTHAKAVARKKSRLVVRERAKRAKIGARPYSARDVTEANRIGAALCRQHSR